MHSLILLILSHGWLNYRDILNMDVIYPYRDKYHIIITRNKMKNSKENIHFISDNIIETLSDIKKQKGKDIWLVGGGEIISILLDNDLIDEMIITLIPIILGLGIPLFPNTAKESTWKLHNTHSTVIMYYRLNTIEIFSHKYDKNKIPITQVDPKLGYLFFHIFHV